MGKCKNDECNNETLNKRVYCSLKCRNVYVNKHLRDYSKNGKGISNIDQYQEKPKKCGCCGDNIPYNKRRNKYCGSSCAAKISNLGKVHTEETKQKMSVSSSGGELKTIQCKNCGVDVLLNDRKAYCSEKCKEEYKRKDMDEFLIYKSDTKFNFGLSDYPKEFNFDLIEEHGWYSPSNSKKPNLGGVSRDHMLSIRDGFNNGVDPKLLSHPSNCKLMVHGDNISKNKNSSITEVELVNMIKDWDKKYTK